MTPDEWMQETGQQNTKASIEEMQSHVDGDASCSSGQGLADPCLEEEADLPWVKAEELLVHQPPFHPKPRLFVAACLATVGTAAAWCGCPPRRSPDEGASAGPQRSPWCASLSLFLLCAAAATAQLLDVTVILLALA